MCGACGVVDSARDKTQRSRVGQFASFVDRHIASAYAPSHSIFSSRTTFSAFRKSLFLNEFSRKFAFKIVAKSLIPLIFLSTVD
jgi:hypothetical protein